MILKLFALCSWFLLVSNVPVAPLIPSQTHPLYPQNEFIIPPGYYPSDINSLGLQNTVQDPNTPTPLNVKQILLNTILSRPSLQEILDPIGRSYGLNFVEDTSTSSVPNVVNNYIILPVECSGDNDTDISRTAKVVDNKNKKKSKRKSLKKRGQINSKPNDVSEAEKHKKSFKIENDQFVVPTPQVNHNPVPKSTRTRNVDRETNKLNKRNERDSNKHCGKKRKQRDSEPSQIIDSIKENANKTQENVTKNTLKRRIKLKASVNDSNLVNAQVTKPDQPVTAKPLRQITNSKKPNTEPNKVVTKKLKKQETNNKNDIPNDFLKTFPNIPENIARNFFTGFNQHSDPQMKSFFSNYENFYQNIITGMDRDGNKRSKKRKKGRKNRRNRRRNQKKTQNIYKNLNKSGDLNLNSTNYNETTLNDVKILDENAIYVSPEIKEINDYVTEPSLEPVLTIPDEVDTTDAPQTKESEICSHYLGLIEDYYPLFTDNADVAANNKELFVRNLDNDKFYYTSDLENKANDQTQIPDDSFLLERSVNNKDIKKHTYESIERESINNFVNNKDSNEELNFRHPPLLEAPDFVTRQIERSEIQPNRFDTIEYQDRVYTPDDKSSTYSKVKTQGIRNGINKSNKPQKDDVETSYASSKVVKYGQIDNSNEDVDGNNVPDWTESFHSDGTTYVVAKTLDNEEYW